MVHEHQTFKLEMPKDDLMKVYNPDFWPCGINIRRYFPPKGGDKRTGSTQSNGETGVNCKHVGVDKYVIYGL